MKKEIVRLPDYIIPSNYSINIEPSEDMNSYKGSIKIKAAIEKPTQNIILHSKNPEIKTTTICVGNQCLLPKITENKDSETINLEVQKTIKGEIEIHIEFNGIVTEDLAGIYKSKYDYKNKTNYLITTQCEAPYARRIFPCFDEPDKKATFDLTIKINKNLKAISNMPTEYEKSEDNKKIIKFKTTPKMSSYLFYLGIGDFEFAEDKYKNVKLRVATTPGKSKNASFALEKTKQYLEYFENYSEIPYPLEKLDLLAIPDFGAGAMENWGAITFRELLILFDKKKTSSSRKKRVAEVIAHELWHQWSGNLVTMKWWKDLWLNESFATYMAYKAADHYNPEWNLWNDYLINELSTGLYKDTLKTTHPIEVEIKSPEEIEEVFDEISYQKGGSVLRMVENYLGEEFFRLGVSNYLKKYAYSNASASYLWNSLDEVSGKKIKEIMKSWISQPGYPLVQVEKTKDGIKVSQKRCNKQTDQLWHIPLSICTESICHNHLLEKKEENYKINEQDIKLNHKQFGFYRTKYSKELLDNLGRMIKNNKLSEQDKWGANHDLWSLTSINEENLKNYIASLDNYETEDSYIILSEIASSIKKIDRLFYNESWWLEIKKKIVKKLSPTYKNQLTKLGWDKRKNDQMEQILLRSLSISFCGFSEDIEVIEEAKKRYNSKDIDADIAGQVYYIIAIKGNKKDYEEMILRYNNEEDVENKIKLLTSIYQFRDSTILKDALDFAFTDKVRVQDLRYIFTSLLSNPLSQEALLNWLSHNSEKIEACKQNHYIMKDFIESVIISQTTKSGREKAKEFLEKSKIQYEMTKTNAFEILDQNLKFIENNKDFLKNM